MFRTSLTPTLSGNPIDLKDNILLTGSCFSVNLGNKLKAHKLSAAINPLGISYNPVSIFQQLQAAIESKPIPNEHIVPLYDQYAHLDYHSSFKEESPEDLKNLLEKQQSTAASLLANSKWLFLTLGTAWVYRFNATDNIVNNCHKLPAAQFGKACLSVNEITKAFSALLAALHNSNEHINIVLTVSPVRHLKEGFVENQRSKAILHVFAQEMAALHAKVSYYPSYEIMIDDLRDYRFYEPDMLHPNEVAIQYIWEHFQQTYFRDHSRSILQQWEKVQRSLQHKAFQPNAAAHYSFQQKLLLKLQQLAEYLPLSEEIAILENAIKNRKP